MTREERGGGRARQDLRGRLVTARPELESLREAFAALSVDTEGALLADHPGRRRVVRVGDIVVKAFAPSERAAWLREKLGLRAMTGSSPTTILTVVDFEDSHIGDPAEDFRWQVLAGPRSLEYSAMRIGYKAAGRTLGPRAAQRLALAGVELCLDVLRWDVPNDRVAAFHDRSLRTLDEFLAGQFAEPP